MSPSAQTANPAPALPTGKTRPATWIRLTPLHALLLGVFAILTSFNNYSVQFVTMLGQAIGTLLLLYACYLLLARILTGGRWPKALRPVLVWSSVFIGIYCVGFIVQGSLKGFRYSVLSALFYLALFVLLASLRYTNSMILAFGWCFGICNGLLGIWWVIAGMPRLFCAHMTNPNLSAGFFGFSLFFILLALQVRQAPLLRLSLTGLGILTLVLTLVSESRAIFLAFLGLITVYYSWRWLSRRRWRFNTVFWVIIAVVITITAVIPVVQMLPFFEEATRLSQEIFHKSLHSGRNLIWALVFKGILEAPILGHGPYFVPRNLFSTDLSAHSLYLQIALQTGLLGVSALLGLLFAVWRVFWQGRFDNRVRLAAGFTAALLIHQTFDVSLTQHNLSLGLLMWMVMGVGAGLALNSPSSPPVLPSHHSTEEAQQRA